MEVVDVILGSLLSMGLTYTFVRCDRLRIPEPWRQRGWNAATTGAAVFTFAPFCIVAHFWVTRRSFRGVIAGVAALVLLLLAQIGLTVLYQQVSLLALAAVLVFPAGILTLAPLVTAAALLT